VETLIDKTRAKVRVSDVGDKTRVPERDFIVKISDTMVNQPHCFYTVNKDNEQAFILNALLHDNSDQKKTAEQIEEEEMKEVERMANREYIFLIDRSGSMQGTPIKLAVQALKVFLHSLPLGCYVNVYSFGSNFETLFESSMEYS
jgi:hypothetical protein